MRDRPEADHASGSRYQVPRTSSAGRPDSPDVADAAALLKSAYVHIPFCRRRCPYCDFAVVTPDEGGTPYTVTRYVQAVIAEIGMEPPWGPLDAVNLGGGTPSSLPPSALSAVLDALKRRFAVACNSEISIEANPEDWEGEYAEAVRRAGFNRVSLGVQSFDPNVLRSLGRSHTPDQAISAVRRSQAVGFESVSLDLIYGTPGETMESWSGTVEAALAVEPDHVSAYSLTVELGTELSRRVRAGEPAPDPDDQADKYLYLADAAEAAGLVRYEISNWARPGHHCRYNLATWAQGEYVAFGLGAHGHRSGLRRRNVRRLDVYLDRIEQAERPEAGSDRIVGWAAEQERLMLGLRRPAGVREGSGTTALLGSTEGVRLMDAKLIEVDSGRVRVCDPLLTDEVVRAVLALPPH
jgi:oxygen-independent coproporphyrinogen-3 oxidase